MKRILMKTSYREFYKPGDVVDEFDSKADELVRLGRAEYMKVEVTAPVNKEVDTMTYSSKGFECDVCHRFFPSVRGLKLHSAKAHK